jgi:hypothetical protein
MKAHRKYLVFFTIVGMNSIFIYLFIEIVGSRWFTEYASAIASGLMEIIQTPVAHYFSRCTSLCFWFGMGLVLFPLQEEDLF